jgi:hypothetical protein
MAEAGEALLIRKQDLAERRFDRCWTAFDRRADHC